ncbi:hypothetical protein GCM10008934_26600 [Virgibacillus salarius]|uniref:DUF5067 domain-containing protein n=1 Tax=Virgibacillus TaxID=84406 RepID=UPI002A91A682|nr:DUF5067 domain-containing protein [Virgibacillus sp. M23]MDY7043952.1 DUF5067 domain-containing protein [Virgibacillus sp. M23]
MFKVKFIFITLISIFLLITGCSNEKVESKNKENEANEEQSESNNNDVDEENKLYHEFGETFELIGYYSDVPAEITVNEVWFEKGEEHKEFIESEISSPSEDVGVTFVDYTVKNVGDSSMTLGDVIPTYRYPTGGPELNLTYPKNDTFKDYTETFQYELAPGETMELKGAVAVEEKYSFEGTLMWNPTQEKPEVVFQIPQDNRRDKIGTYDIGEDMYIDDRGKNRFYRVRINEIEIIEEDDSIQKSMDDSSFLVMDMEFENQLKEERSLYSTFPNVMLDGKETIHSPHLKIDGNAVDDLYEGEEGKIAPGETIKGKVFMEVQNSNIEDIKLMYLSDALLTYPDFSLKINYDVSK